MEIKWLLLVQSIFYLFLSVRCLSVGCLTLSADGSPRLRGYLLGRKSLPGKWSFLPSPKLSHLIFNTSINMTMAMYLSFE